MMKIIKNNNESNNNQFEDNPEIQKALDIIQNTNESLLLTGEAGTGKSHFIRYLKENLDLNIVVVAPTGIAAQNIGGSTIHSFFCFPTKPLLEFDSSIKKFKKDSAKREQIQKMDLLIIDEVSMVDGSLKDAISTSLKRNTGNKKPFGGKQILMVGDPFQLPPVARGEKLTFLKEQYNGKYLFFDAKTFTDTTYRSIVLQKNYRHEDQDFIHLLRKVKIGLSYDFLPILNKRYMDQKEIDKLDYVLTIATTNAIVNEVNKTHLDKLLSKEFTFMAEIEGEYPKDNYPTEETLLVKEGAQIIFTDNDEDKRWVNGTIGVIDCVNENGIWVKLKDGIVHQVIIKTWENNNYIYNDEKGTFDSIRIGSFTQYPMKLAWALTIHKAQGMTLEKVIVDTGTGAFCHGQLYVALSRVRKFENLILKTPIKRSDIQTNYRVRNKFYFEMIEPKEDNLPFNFNEAQGK